MPDTQPDDKLVTRDDLPRLRYMKEATQFEPGDVRDLLDRLIAAAEADQPQLPEGWVLRGGLYAHYYRQGALYLNGHCTQMTYAPDEVQRLRDAGKLTPLRTTVDGAGLERAAIALAIGDAEVSDRTNWPHWASTEGVQQAWLAHARRVLEAAGFEVQA